MQNLKPIILTDNLYSESDLNQLKKNKIWAESDVFESQVDELFEINFPQYKFKSLEDRIKPLGEYKQKYLKEHNGSWVYLPWSGVLIHMVNEQDYNLLRTNRNKNLVTSEEQQSILNTKAAVVGLSIGSSIAVTLAYGGISKLLLAENDTLETTNLNRIRSGVEKVGMKKIDICSQSIYEINPYADLTFFSQGLTPKNVEEFVKSADVIFEAIDDFEMKVRLRLSAKNNDKPVVMLTNLGDSVLIDIERYDLDNSLQLFNGRAGNTPEEILEKPITPSDVQKYAVEIVGRENVPPRALASLPEIGKTLVGRPQLVSTVTVAGGFSLYILRKIIFDNLQSGRYRLSFDDILYPHGLSTK